jgi:hypothetical protein
MRIREYSCLFFHIPKTAGNSIEHWLIGEALDPAVANHERLFGWDREGDFNLQHATPAMAREIIGAEEFERCFRFAVVRNPFARAVSVYHYLSDYHQQRFGSFERYVRTLPQLIQDADAKRQRRFREHHFPQVSYTHLDGQCCCHEVIRFERLPDSLGAVAERLGITRPLPFENAYRHPSRNQGPVSSFYTRETARLLAEVYAEDFETFGYSTDPEAADDSEGWKIYGQSGSNPTLQANSNPTPISARAWQTSDHEALLLLCRSRHTESAAQSLRQRLEGGMDWDKLIQRMLDQDVAPLAARRLLEFSPERLRDEQREGLEIYLEGERLRAQAQCAELADLLRRLGEQGIPAIPFKGPKLALDIYRDAGLRGCRDLDILIPEAEVARGLSLLLSLGYRHDEGLNPRQIEAVRGYGGQYILSRPEKIPVEPHWEIAPRTLAFDLDYDRLWRSARPGEFVGAPCLLLPPEEELLLLCLHGAKEQWRKLKLVCDIEGYLAAHPEIDWNRLYTVAEAQGCARMLNLGLALARRLLDAPLPEIAAQRIVQDKDAERLAAQTAQAIAANWWPALDPYRLIGYYWQMRERRGDRWRYAARTLFTPRAVHYGLLNLPRELDFAYYPLKLAWDYLAVPGHEFLIRFRTGNTPDENPSG